MIFVLDTNILLSIVRNEVFLDNLIEEFGLFKPDVDTAVSVVSIGEIRSIALRNRWGFKRHRILSRLINDLLVIDINAEDILNLYAEIDAFSQNKLTHKPLGMSARNMGKNDLWIAATTAATNATLLTMDKDFSHLHTEFFPLEVVSL